MWRWLGFNKDAITALMSIIQATIVVLGVVFTVNKILNDDRVAQRDKATKTSALYAANLELRKDLDELYFKWEQLPPANRPGAADLHMEVGNALFDLQPKMNAFYSQLEIGLQNGQLDESMAKQFFAITALDDAKMVADLRASFLDPKGPKMNQFHFAVRCFPEYKMRSGRPDWLDDYIKAFPDAEAVRSGRLKFD